MSPIRVEIAGYPRIDRNTFNEDEERIISLGGGEGISIRRLPGEKELYIINQVDPINPNTEDHLQQIFIGTENPSGHFFIGDTKIYATYIKR